MSTRSAVMVQIGKQIKAIYVHHDGYPSGVGSILNKHFNSQQSAEALIRNGNRGAIDRFVAGALKQSSAGLFIDEFIVRNLVVEFYREIRPDYNLTSHCYSTNYNEPAETYDSYLQAVDAWIDLIWIRFCYFWDGKIWWVNNYPLADILEQIGSDFSVEYPADSSSWDGYESWKSRLTPQTAQI